MKKQEGLLILRKKGIAKREKEERKKRRNGNVNQYSAQR
jgi:hypothetical protein